MLYLSEGSYAHEDCSSLDMPIAHSFTLVYCYFLNARQRNYPVVLNHDVRGLNQSKLCM